MLSSIFEVADKPRNHGQPIKLLTEKYFSAAHMLNYHAGVLYILAGYRPVVCMTSTASVGLESLHLSKLVSSIRI